MWVIPKNLQASNGSLAGLETIRDSAELSRICAASLFVRGKDTQSATWLRRWNKGGWHQRLSGRIAAPSPSNRSLIEGWISSLLPTHAKESLSPATNSGPRILDSYGRIVESSLQQLDLFSAFSKTSEGTSTPQWSKSSATWQSFSTQLSQEYSQRKSVAALIRGKGSLSWRDGWKTPTVPNGGRVNPAGTSETGIDPDGVKRQIGLEQQAAKLWRTPTDDSNRGGAQCGEKRLAGGHTMNLQDQVLNWPTPTVHGDHNPLPAPTMTPDGLECFALPHTSHPPSDGRRLNVFFVEWLMGWPMNHTCTRCGACSAKIALIASECSETESIRIPQP